MVVVGVKSRRRRWCGKVEQLFHLLCYKSLVLFHPFILIYFYPTIFPAGSGLYQMIHLIAWLLVFFFFILFHRIYFSDFSARFYIVFAFPLFHLFFVLHICISVFFIKSFDTF